MKRILSYLFPLTLYRTSSSYNRDIAVRLIDGKPALVVNGVIQSGARFQKIWRNVFRHFRLDQEKNPKTIAVVGVGGGDILKLLHTQYPTAAIRAVDIDAVVIDLAKQYFGADMVGTQFVVQDAQKFFPTKKKFDLVVLDLYIGNDHPSFLSDTVFLRTVKQSLLPQSRVIVNYLRAKEEKDGSFRVAAQKVFGSVSSFDIAYNRFFFLQ